MTKPKVRKGQIDNLNDILNDEMVDILNRPLEHSKKSNIFESIWDGIQVILALLIVPIVLVYKIFMFLLILTGFISILTCWIWVPIVLIRLLWR